MGNYIGEIQEKYEYIGEIQEKSPVQFSVNTTMVGENFEIYISQMGKNTLKLSTMVGENFEIYISQMEKNALKK